MAVVQHSAAQLERRMAGVAASGVASAVVIGAAASAVDRALRGQ